MATCPVCAETGDPAKRVGSVAVCAACGASYVIESNGHIRRATSADTTVLSAADLQTLRKARGRTR